jgi:ketosteroid isomerase-like protein
MRSLALSILLVLVTLGGCAFTQEIDRAAVLEELMQADRDFAIETAERGADGWADWFDTHGTMFPKSGRVDGQEAIRERMSAAFAPGNPRLVWEPESAEVSEAGDLGYTIGRWQTVAGETGEAEQVLGTGYYVSIWRRNAEGAWRVALDIGNSDEEE